MTKRPPATAPVAIELRAALTHLNRQLRVADASDGPGAAKFSVLGQLYRAGPLTPTALARLERVKLQSLTRLLAELEADACLERRPHEHDGRQSLLSLTRRGAALLTAEVHRRERSLADAIGRGLSPHEQALLHEACALLDRVADAIERGPLQTASRRPSRQAPA